MKALSRTLSAITATLLLAVMVWAGPYEDADKAFRAGNYQQAITLLQEAQQQNPDDVRVYAAMGRSYRKLGNDDAAREAYTEFLRRDPNLKSLRDNADRQNFLKAFRAIGGQVPARSGGSPAQGAAIGTNASDIFNALASGNVYVVPSLQNEIDAGQLEQTAAEAAPLKVKILVVKGLGGYQSREALAEDIRKRLRLDENSVVIVATPKGVSGSSGRLSNDQINQAIQAAGIDTVLAQQGPTAMIAEATRSVINKSRTDRSSDSGGLVGGLAIAAIGVGGFLLIKRAKREGELRSARERVETRLRDVVTDLSYVDGYLDLLPASDDATQAKRLRASAFEKYDTAKGLIKTGKTVPEIEQGLPLLQDAKQELVECRKAIDRATGGTGVAMSVPDLPDLATDVEKARRYRAAEEIRSAEERSRMQRELGDLPEEERGVSFFSGQPMPASLLVPVTVVIAGHKRTVMATPEEAEQIRNGHIPPIRSFQDPVTRQYVPWYEYRDYDPYRDYYAYNSNLLATSMMIDLAILSAQLGAGVYSHYGPWGYQGYGWGMPMPAGGWYVYDSGPNYSYHQDPWFQPSPAYDQAPTYQPEPVYEPEHAGGMDLFGQQDYQEQSSGFDFSGSDSSSSSSWDFGSSSSSDSGWSSSDSGSSSSDFGGSSDW